MSRFSDMEQESQLGLIRNARLAITGTASN